MRASDPEGPATPGAPDQTSTRQVVVNVMDRGAPDFADPEVEESRPVLMFVADAPAGDPLLEATLEQEGYRVVTLQPGADALETFRRYRPQGLIFEVAAPEGGALGVCHMLKTHPLGWDVPALVVSTGLDPAILQAAGAAGAHELMSRPFAPDVLVDTIRRLVGSPTSP